MTNTTDRLQRILVGDLAGSMLQAALTGSDQGQVPGFRYEVDRMHIRPGAETNVTYRVWYTLAGQEVSDFVVATSAAVAGTASVTLEGQTVNVWRYPDDPGLPALPLVTDPDVLSDWLGAPVVPDQLGLFGYRPLRRAVVRIAERPPQLPRARFVKVVRPGQLADLVLRHEVFAAAGLGPGVCRQVALGAVITEAAPGRSLANLLSAWQRGRSPSAPTPQDLIRALDRLPVEIMNLSSRPSWTDRCWFHTELAATALPSVAHEIRELGERISELAGCTDRGPLVPTHGDCYEANIFWNGPQATFIDLDSAGPGHRVDDLACILAHLVVLPQLSVRHYPHGHEVAATWFTEFARHCDPAALCVRVAAVLLSLVAGGQIEGAWHRLDLVRGWLLRAEEYATGRLKIRA